MKLKITLFSLFFFITNMVFSQPWMEYVDADKKKQDGITFFDIQKAFNKYTKAHNVKKGYIIKDGEKHKFGGWKQYKRWEHFWEVRVDPKTGEFPEKTPFQVSKKSIQNKEKLTDNSNWVNLGTDSSKSGYHGIGRLNCIEFHPEDNNTYWVGAPSGGLWKTTNDGTSWETLTDTNAVIGVSDIAIPSDYDTSKTIYIATGDRDAKDNYSTGVLKSTDGGTSWQVSLPFDVANRDLVNHLLIDPNNDSTLTAATTQGIMKTTDAGESWDKIHDVVLKDIEFKPGNAGIIYGSTSSDPTKIYRSTDSGKTWTESLSLTGSRTELTVSADNPEVVYAVVANTNNGLKGVYKSTNSGIDFTEVYSDKNLLGWESDGSDEGGQGWYDLTIISDPNHADTVFIGGINTWRSVDGGNSWKIVNHWTGDRGIPTAHADKHAMEYQNGSSVLFEGNDGGIYRTTDAGNNWEDLTNGMVISQIYKLATAQSDTDIVINGLQDNGTKLYFKGNWYDIIGGDGMDCMIDHENSDIQYGTQYYGAIYRTKDGWNNSTEITPSGAEEGAWVTPFAMHPENPATIYGGYTNLWKSTNRGDSWSEISDMNSYYKIRSISISESDPKYIYMADPKNIWMTSDEGSNWIEISDGLPLNEAAITNIEVSYNNPDVVWVTMGGYNNNNLYKSTDGGSTWTNISAGLPSLPVLDVVQDNSYSKRTVLYAGTDVGVYKKVDDSEWNIFSNQLPNVIVNDLAIYYDKDQGKNVLRAATYGRGLWETQIVNENFVNNPSVVKTNAFVNSTEITWNFNSDNDTILLASTSDGDFSSLPSSSVNYNNVDTLNGGENVLFFGNSKDTYTHNSLNPNTEYNYRIWSYDGENYSTGESFTIKTTCNKPSTQVSNIEFSNVKKQSIELSWDRGNGDNVIILARKSGDVDSEPVCGKTYTANTTFGEGDELGNGNFVVYNGKDTSAIIDGLDYLIKYYFAIYEYNSEDNCYLFPPETANVITEAASTGIDEEASGLKIYPNPANKKFVVTTSSKNSPAKLEAIDMTGKTVFRKIISDNRKVINIEDWDKGTYIIKLFVNKEIFKEKLIVK